MSSSDLPKLWTEPTKIRHIFRRQSTLKIKFFQYWSFQKILFIKVDLLVKYSSQKKIRNIELIFDAEERLWKAQILQTLRRFFIMLEGLTMTWFSEKMLIISRCNCGFMSNLFKKSSMVSSTYIWQLFT